MLEALREGEEIERQKQHAAEMAIAQLTAVYINSQKTKPPYYSPQDFCLFAPKTDSQLPEKVVATIHNLRRDELLPVSAGAWLPWESIPALSSDRSLKIPKRLRMLRTRGAWAIAPEIEGNFIYIPIGVVEVYGKVQLNDPDTKCIYDVEIPKPTGHLVRDTWWLFLGKTL